MSKFHEEFFRQGSLEHDRLVAKVIEHKKEIAELFKYHVNDLWKDDVEKGYTIFICRVKDKPTFCSIDEDLAWSKRPECFGCKKAVAKVTSDFWGMPNETICSPLTCKANAIISPTNAVFSVEKLCKGSNGFIIGYADVVLCMAFALHINLIISDSWSWKDYIHKEPELRVVVECKPNLETWSPTLRQIKTYMDLLQVHFGIIATYSAIPEQYQEIMKSERVGIIRFSKENGEILYGNV